MDSNTQGSVLKKIGLNSLFKRLLFLVPLGVVGNLIFVYFTTHERLSLKQLDISIPFLIGAFFLSLIPWLTNTLRVKNLTKLLGYRLSLKNIFKIVLGAELGSAITPTAVGGGYLKISMLMQNGLSSGQALSVTTMGSFEDAIFFLIVLPMGLIMSKPLPIPLITDLFKKIQLAPIISLILVAIIFLMLLSLLFLSPFQRFRSRIHLDRINFKIKKIYRDFKQVFWIIFHKGKAVFLINLFLTAVQWISRYSVITLLLLSLNLSVNPIQFFVMQWVVFTILNVVPTPGASGGAEVAFYTIYQAVVPVSVISVVTSAWRFITFYFLQALGAGLFFLLNLESKNV